MKFFLLSVVCLVGSALSLPVASNRQRRDILPGDPRYGTDYHLHHHHHDNHDNGGFQVVKSVGEYSGSYNSPAPVYGPPGYQPGTPVSYPDQSYQTPTVHEQHYNPIIPSTSYGVPVQQHEEHHQEQHHNHHPQQHHEHHHHQQQQQQHHEHHQEQHYQQQYHFEHQYQQTQPIHYQQQHQEHHYQSPQVSYGPPIAVKEQSVIAKETRVPITSYGTPVESHVHQHQHQHQHVQVPVQKTVAPSNQHLSPAVEQHRQPQQHHVVQIQRHQVQQVKVPQYSYQPHYTPQVKQQPKPQPKPQPAQVYYQPQPIQTHYQPQPIQTHYQPAPQPTNNYLTPVIEVKKTQTVHHYQPQPAPQPTNTYLTPVEEKKTPTVNHYQPQPTAQSTNTYLTPVEEKKAPTIDHYQPQPSPQPTHAYLTPVEEKKTPTIDHYPSQQAPQPTNIYLTPVEHEPKIAYTPAIKSVTVETAPAPQTYAANDTPAEETSSSGHPFPGFSDLSQIQKFAEFPPLEDSPLPSADQFSNSAQAYNDAVDIDSVNQGYNYNNNIGNTFTGYTSEQPTQEQKPDDHVEQQLTVSQEQTHKNKETIQQVDSDGSYIY
ncbi:putative mediator of RNA polymerase II transcription subunit 12 [Microplitis demolitor]|uniref:putative mediator of RNA polymerase II transcription subunit 12 n=1 Tax=Microplitis demolitor TaxID=69319 RepID=UPI0004CCB2C5|nr:putative mediator of RNA polymerase II transcription subunit 12 [Microplitis demolitor]